MAGSKTINLTFGTAPTPGGTQADKVNVFLMNSSNQSIDEKTIPAPGGVPSESSVTFTSIPAGTGYTAIGQAYTPDNQAASAPFTSAPFDVADDVDVLLVTGVAAS